MKEKQTQMWIPLYVDKWIFGSTRIELEPAERGVFVDLMAFGAKDEGYIRANEITAYPHTQLAGLLNIPVELLNSTIAKCIHFAKLEETSPGIYKLCNWDKFQFSRQYVHEVNTKGIPSLQNCKVDLTTCKPIRKDRIVEDKIEKNTTTSSEVGVVDKLVNWDNCKSDLQRLLAHYVMREMPDMYASATQAQANSLFKRYGRAASEVLGVAGNLPTAIRAFDLAMAHFNGKGLSWNLSTVSKNIGEFVNQAMNERRNTNGIR